MLLRNIIILKFKSYWYIFLSFIPLLIVIYLLFDSHIIKPDKFGNLLTGESTYGDLPFHLSTISQVAYSNIFPPENPLYANTPLAYPYFINLLSSFLVMIGLSLRNSIILPGMFFSVLIITCLYLFNKKILKSNRASILAVYLFFLNCGLGFFYFVRDVVFGGKLSSFLSNPTPFPDYSHLFGENIQWCNFLSRILVPERSVLLGIPLGLAILLLLFMREDKPLKIVDVRFIIAAILAGLLPLSHTHTFMVFAFLLPYLAIFEIQSLGFRKWLIKWSTFGVIVFLIAIPQLRLVFSHLNSSSTFFRFHIGWMSKPGILELLIFWLKNTGILIPLLIISLFTRPPKILKKLVYFSLFIFTIINLFLFQPYNWDNVKFLFWFAIFAYVAVAHLFVSIWQKKSPLAKLFVIFSLLFLTLSSFISIYREIKVKFQLFSKEDVYLGVWVREKTPVGSLFLTTFAHNSFVSNLGGRKILMGYQGSLWVHGIKYGDRERDIKEIYSGSSLAMNLINKYRIDYVIIGPGERNDLKANELFFQKNLCLVKRTENYLIYSVKSCLER